MPVMWYKAAAWDWKRLFQGLRCLSLRPRIPLCRNPTVTCLPPSSPRYRCAREPVTMKRSCPLIKRTISSDIARTIRGAIILTQHEARNGPDSRRHNKYWEGADLVKEVVSGSEDDRQRDLVTKRREYAQAGIPEYWIKECRSPSLP